MRVLYGIQGTGNGHISRAMEIVPALKKHAEVDLLISGTQSELDLPFDLTYRLHGLGFVFGKKGGIDLLATYKKSRLKRFYKEVRDLPVDQYDLVISDFEPVTAWACLSAKKTCVGLSNQWSLLSPKVPVARSEDLVGKFIIRNYAPCTLGIGFSYACYDSNIYTPVIRRSLREAVLQDKGHVAVYLPSYSDEKIIEVLRHIEGVDWHVFSKNSLEKYSKGNISVHPLSREAFEESIVSAHGIITAAGFGTTTEALFMGKKLLVIPQKHQYEQACNALALQQMGIRVVKSMKSKHIDKIKHWITLEQPVRQDYPCLTDDIVSKLLQAAQAGDHSIDYHTEI